MPKHLRRCLIALVAAMLPVAVRPAATAQERQPSGLELATAIEQVLVDAIAAAEKSVVAIARVRTEEGAPPANLGLRLDPVDPFRLRIDPSKPTDPDFIPHEFGTGVVVDQRGLILTQDHVLKEGDEHWVTTADRKIYRAKIKAADQRSGLAIVEVEARNLVPIRMGDAAQLRKGQIVLALGNPYAIARDGQVSASWGIVANVSRKAGPTPTSDAPTDKPSLHHFGTLIQTDAKLNLGTSGGALLNLRGELVGLTTSLAATAGFETAAGYAVPMDATYKRIIEVLKQGREVEYGLLGIRTDNLPAKEVQQGKFGMLVGGVVGGTPADGVLQAGDVVTHVNARPVYGADGLMLEIGKLPAGSMVQLTFERDGRVHQKNVELAKNWVWGRKIVTTPSPSWRGVRVDYATAIDDYPARADRQEIDFNGCVVITEVEEGSPAWNEGLRPKMFISHVANKQVANPKDFYEAVEGQPGPVRLQLTLPKDQQPLRTIPPAN